MPLLDAYRTHAAYNAWMNSKLYDACAQLSEEQRKADVGAFFKSIHGTLNHLLLADRVWLVRLTGQQDDGPLGLRDEAGAPVPFRSLDQWLYDDFEALRRERVRTDDAIAAFVASLAEADLERPFTYRTARGEPCEHVLWWTLSHVFNHQTHHRGQVTTLLTQVGVDPGVTDLIAMLRASVPKL